MGCLGATSAVVLERHDSWTETTDVIVVVSWSGGKGAAMGITAEELPMTGRDAMPVSTCVRMLGLLSHVPNQLWDLCQRMVLLKMASGSSVAATTHKTTMLRVINKC
jgi:hypothetical protein